MVLGFHMRTGGKTAKALKISSAENFQTFGLSHHRPLDEAKDRKLFTNKLYQSQIGSRSIIPKHHYSENKFTFHYSENKY